jgi:hypothetical protein
MTSTGQPPGRPVAELSDVELEQQGAQAHATRNWVFLHGTAEQFARHTTRMLELEQEYLRRFPKRTWQGSGGAIPADVDEATALRSALHAIIAQLEALSIPPAHEPVVVGPDSSDPVRSLLALIAAAPSGRMHKLEVHQAARESGVDRTVLASLYTSSDPVLVADQQYRAITAAGRARLERSQAQN